MRDLTPSSTLSRLLSTTALALCLTLALPAGPGLDSSGSVALADDNDDDGDDNDDGGDDNDDGGDGDDGDDGDDGGDDGDD
ncbi:MAG: hypothetical protein MI785_22925, partial [Kiloniellales bacterium]|nr:hypothetical protein [Kiloniellales bacterium]